jgi:NAD(P)H-nitrite reductase large subunit
MEKEDHVCVCHRVSLGKLTMYIHRENPKVASQLSQCLGAGTSCGWCIPFLEKIHKQHIAGDTIALSVDSEKYAKCRKEYKNNK